MMNLGLCLFKNNHMPYLTKKITGAASGNTYGMPGDEVSILFDHQGILVVCNQLGDKFPVRRTDLCTSYNHESVVETVEVKEKNMYSKKKTVSPKLPKFNQPTLF